MAKKITFILVLLLFPLSCLADGGGPILLLINAYVFSAGQVWIILSEFIYLFILFKPFPKLKILKLTLIMNLLSTFLGAILFPLLLALVTIPGLVYMKTNWGGLLMALGTWIAGDNSPHPKIAIGAMIAGFFITFILTVYIEYKYLKYQSKSEQIPLIKNQLSHSIYFNCLSYAGLILMFLVFQRY